MGNCQSFHTDPSAVDVSYHIVELAKEPQAPQKKTYRRDMDGSGTVLTAMSDRSMLTSFQSSQSSTFTYPAPLHEDRSEVSQAVTPDKSEQEVGESASQRRHKSHTRRSRMIEGPMVDVSGHSASKRRSRRSLKDESCHSHNSSKRHSRRSVKDESSTGTGSRRSRKSSRRSLKDGSTSQNSSRRSRKSTKEASIGEHPPKDKRQTMKRAESFAVRVSASRKHKSYLQLSDSMPSLEFDTEL